MREHANTLAFTVLGCAGTGMMLIGALIGRGTVAIALLGIFAFLHLLLATVYAVELRKALKGWKRSQDGWQEANTMLAMYQQMRNSPTI